MIDDTIVEEMLEDIQEDEAKENKSTKCFNKQKAFSTPSTILKPKFARRSLGMFTTPTAYYQDLLTDFGSVYGSKTSAVFRTPCKTSDNSSISQNKCGRIKRISEEGETFEHCEMSASATILHPESKVCKSGNDLPTDTKNHDNAKSIDSVSMHLDFQESVTPLFVVPEEPEALVDHQEITTMSEDYIKDRPTCSLSSNIKRNTRPQKCNNICHETQSHHDFENIEHCKSLNIDDESIRSSEFLKPLADDGKQDIPPITHNAQSTFEIVHPKEAITDSKNTEERLESNFESEDCIESTANSHISEIPETESIIDSLDMVKGISVIPQNVDSHEKDIGSMEHKSTKGTSEEKCHVPNVSNVVMTDSRQASNFLDTKTEDSQNTEDSGVCSLSSRIDVLDKLELDNKDGICDEVLPCCLSEQEIQKIDERPMSTKEHLSEVDSVNDHIVEKFSLEKSIDIECANVPKVSSVVMMDSSQASNLLESKNEDSQNTEDSGVCSLSSRIGVLDRLELDNKDGIGDEVLPCCLSEEDIQKIDERPMSTKEVDSVNGHIVEKFSLEKSIECAKVPKVSSVVMTDSSQASNFLETKNEDSQNTEDSGVCSLSGSIGVLDKLELDNKDGIGDEVLPCCLSEQDIQKIDERPMSTKEVDSVNGHIVEKFSLEKSNEIECAKVPKVSSVVMTDSSQASNFLETKTEDSQNTEDSGVCSLSGSIGVLDKLELDNKDGIDDEVQEQDIQKIDERLMSTEEHLSEVDSVNNHIVEKLSLEKSIEIESSKVTENLHHDEKFNVDSSESYTKMNFQQLNDKADVKNDLDGYIKSDDYVAKCCESKNIVEFDAPVCPSTGQCAGKFESLDNVRTKQNILSSWNTTQGIYEQGTLALLEDTGLHLFNENTEKRKKKNGTNKGRRKSMRLQLKEIQSLLSGDNSIQGDLARPKVQQNTEVDSTSTCMEKPVVLNDRNEQVLQKKKRGRPRKMKRGLTEPAATTPASHKLKKTCTSSSTFSSKETETSSDTVGTFQDTGCNSVSTFSSKDTKGSDAVSIFQKPCTSSHISIPKETKTVDYSLNADIFSELNGLDDLDIFKEVTETSTKERTKKRRAKKLLIDGGKKSRRRSARLAGIPVQDNPFVIEQATDSRDSSAVLGNFCNISEDNSRSVKEEETLCHAVSQRKFRKIKRTSFGKPLLLMNTFGTILEPTDEACDEESMKTAEQEVEETDNGRLNVCVDTCEYTVPCEVKSDNDQTAPVFADVDVPNVLESEIGKLEESSSTTALTTATDPPDMDVLVDTELDLPCNPEEGPSVKRQSYRRKRPVISKNIPKKKKTSLEMPQPMSTAEIQQLYLNRGHCPKVIKPNLLETIFEASQNEDGIKIGGKKLNRKVTFQCPWLPRKRSKKNKGKRLIGKTRKYKVSDQVLMDKLDSVLNGLDAYETLLL